MRIRESRNSGKMCGKAQEVGVKWVVLDLEKGTELRGGGGVKNAMVTVSKLPNLIGLWRAKDGGEEVDSTLDSRPLPRTKLNYCHHSPE